MPKELYEDQIEELREMFDFYDRDSNGTIDLEEFGQLCEALGEGFGADEMLVGFDAIDTNQNGVIEFSEFIEWWKNQ